MIAGIAQQAIGAGDLSGLNAMPAPMAPLTPGNVTDGGTAAQTGGFSNMLASAVNGLANQVQSSDRLQELAATGQLTDPTQAIVETTKAELALSTAVQVRNKVIEGWQELSRMSI